MITITASQIREGDDIRLFGKTVRVVAVETRNSGNIRFATREDNGVTDQHIFSADREVEKV